MNNYEAQGSRYDEITNFYLEGLYFMHMCIKLN